MSKGLALTAMAGLIAAMAASLSVAQPDGRYDGGNDDDGRPYRDRDVGDCRSGGLIGGILDHFRGRTLNVLGLTSDQRLVCFNEFKPERTRDVGHVSGLYNDTKLVGIDFRVQDGKLYGVGNAGGVYVIDTSNAVATLVNRLTVALNGTNFGVDFNPAADRLRITSDAGQNLRHNVNAGGTTLVDDPLDYPVPTMLNSVGPTALGIGGSAYTNNDLDMSTSTTLYVLDSSLDQIAIQSPPNDGTLAATGKLGVDTSAVVGFDIYSTLRKGITVSVQSLASLTVDGKAGLYSVSLPTGKATPRGSFRHHDQVVDIAIPLNQL